MNERRGEQVSNDLPGPADVAAWRQCRRVNSRWCR